MSSPVLGYAQALTYAARADRQVQNVKMTGKTATTTRDGVVLSSVGPNMDVTSGSGIAKVVAAGNAMVAGYSVQIPASVTVTPAAVTTARRDLIILRVYDTEAGDATNEAKVEIVKGTAANTDPTLPARSIRIAHVELAANASTPATSPLTDRRDFTAAAGAVVPRVDGPSLTYNDLAPGQMSFDAHSSRWYGRTGNSLRSIGANFSSSQSQYYVGEDWIGVGTYGHREKNFTISEYTNVLLLFASVNLMVDGPDGASIINVGLRWNGTVVTSTVVNTLGSPVGYTFFGYPMYAAVSNVNPGTYEFRYDLQVGAGRAVRTHHWNFHVVALV